MQPLVLGTTVVLRRPVRHRSGCNVYFPHIISTDDEPPPAMPTDRRYRDPSYWLGRHGITESESFETGTCETCGDEFRYYPSVRDGQFCSEACSHEPTKRQVSVTCPNCGTEFERRASLNSVYCSPDAGAKIST